MDEAKAIADDFYRDPGCCLPAFTRLAYERQKLGLGEDIWPSGLDVNRRNLEEFIEDLADQSLIARPMPVDSLFHASVRGT